MLLYITYFIGIVPITLVKVRKHFSAEIYYLEPLLWLMLFATFYESIATLYFNVPSAVWFRTFILLEFACLFYFFYKVFKGRFKPLFAFFAIVFLALFIYLLTIWKSTPNLLTDSYLIIVEAVFVFVCSFIWFQNIFKLLEVQSLRDSSVFYFISGFILYFSGTFFLFLMTNSILVNKGTNLMDYWILNIVFTLIMRILIIIGIWKGQKKLHPYSG